MSVENVYQNIESILQRIDSIKRRFGTYRSYSFEQILQNKIEESEAKDELQEAMEQQTEDLAVPGAAPDEGTSAYDGIIEAAAERFRIPSALIRAVIKQESNFDSSAVSHKGAMGLMQLMPETAELLGVENPFEPDENIFGGTRYLVDLIGLYGGNLNKALAAYNAGPQNVGERVPNIPETRDFVDSVLYYYESFSKTKDEEGF